MWQEGESLEEAPPAPGQADRPRMGRLTQEPAPVPEGRFHTPRPAAPTLPSNARW